MISCVIIGWLQRVVALGGCVRMGPQVAGATAFMHELSPLCSESRLLEYTVLDVSQDDGPGHGHGHHSSKHGRSPAKAGHSVPATIEVVLSSDFGTQFRCGVLTAEIPRVGLEMTGLCTTSAGGDSC
jgi:hypothetical protein